MEASDGAAVGEVGEPASLGGEILLSLKCMIWFFSAGQDLVLL